MLVFDWAVTDPLIGFWHTLNYSFKLKCKTVKIIPTQMNSGFENISIKCIYKSINVSVFFHTSLIAGDKNCI